MPPVLNENILTYIDLDIDVLVEPDLSYRVVDLEEFAENAEVHKYPPEIIERAKESLSELILRIEKRQFPFDYNLKEETIKD
jgi:protein associated with RNAse G/E